MAETPLTIDDRLIRVLQLATRLNVGGPARQILELAASSDVKMSVAAGWPPEAEGELTDPRVEVIHLPLVRALSPATDAGAFRAVRRLLVDQRPDVLHTHMAKAGALGRAAVSSLRSGTRTVHTFHGHVLDGYFRRPAERAFLEIERRLARRTDLLIAVSQEIRDDLLGLGIGRPEQWRVVPLGLDLQPFMAAERTGALRKLLEVPKEAPLIGMVGRLAPVKDHRTALLALREVPDAHLAIVGDGELREELGRLATSLGLGNRVHFTGWWADIPSVFADLDIVLLTSTNEGTPVSLIEAAAAGVPVVATAVGGVPTVVHDGATGLLTGPGEPSAIATGIRTYLSDPDLRNRVRMAARQHVLARFSLVTAVENHADLYRELTACQS